MGLGLRLRLGLGLGLATNPNPNLGRPKAMTPTSCSPKRPLRPRAALTAVKRAMVTKGPIEPKMEGGTALGALSLVRVRVRANLTLALSLALTQTLTRLRAPKAAT